MKKTAVEAPAKLKKGVAFALKGARQTFVVLTAHRDGSVSFAPENEVYFLNPVTLGKDTVITKLSQTEFQAQLRDFVESRWDQAARRKQELEESIRLAKELESDWELAIFENILFDAKNGRVPMERMVSVLTGIMDQARKESFAAGSEEGFENGVTQTERGYYGN